VFYGFGWVVTLTRRWFGLLFVCILLNGCAPGGPNSSVATRPIEAVLLRELGLTSDRGAMHRASMAGLQRQQERVAECMRAKGFEYVPFVPVDAFNSRVEPPVGSEVRWKREHGYGIADALENVKPAVTNPNEAIVGALDTVTRDRYDLAMDRDGLYSGSETLQSAGCARYYERTSADRDFSKVVVQKYLELDQEFRATALVVELSEKWQACMRTKGLSSAGGEVGDELLRKEIALVAKPFALDGKIPKDAIETFRVAELKVANSDADCASQEVVNELRQIRDRLEVTFVKTNRAALESARENLFG
jgi:hypothetical protein